VELTKLVQEKKITLVQKSEQVLNDSYKDKLRRYVETRIRGEGVNLILGDTVIDTKPVDGVVQSSSGQHISADLLVSESMRMLKMSSLTHPRTVDSSCRSDTQHSVDSQQPR